MKENILFAAFLVIIISMPNVNAGREIIDYMTDIIYSDCEGQDIDATNLGLINTATNESIPVIKWPYKISYVQRVVEIIIDNEPYSVYVGGGHQTLLSCGNKELAVNFYTYTWNGERIDPFIYNYNRTVNEIYNMIQHVEGSYKPVQSQCAGDNCSSEAVSSNWFSDNMLIVSISISLAISFAFTFSLYLILRKKLPK